MTNHTHMAINSQMKQASVSEAKNGLSGLLSEVRRGEGVGRRC